MIFQSDASSTAARSSILRDTTICDVMRNSRGGRDRTFHKIINFAEIYHHILCVQIWQTIFGTYDATEQTCMDYDQYVIYFTLETFIWHTLIKIYIYITI